jgi:tetratricopeptide (TPR) repeat protein
LSLFGNICRKILSTLTFFLPFHFASAQNTPVNEDSLILIQAQRFFESGRYDSSVLLYEKYLSMVTLSRHSSTGIPDQKAGGDKVRYLKVLLYLGTCYNLISDPENAQSVLNSGLKIAESELIDEPVIKALFFYQIGNACILKMDYQNSIRSYQNALALIRNDDVLVMKINQNLGGIFFFMEDYDNAIEHYQKALVIKSESVSTDPLKTAELLINIGSAFVEKNEFITADEYFSKAENLFKGTNKTDLQKQARLSLSLGNLLMKMNKPKDAHDQFMKASQLYHLDLPVKPDEMILLYTNLAQLYKSQFVFDSTIYYYNLAVSLIPDQSERYVLALANLYHNIGETYGMQSNWNTALRYYQKALELLIPSDSNSLTTSGLKTRNPVKALELFRIRQDRARTLWQMGLDEESDDIILQSFN